MRRRSICAFSWVVYTCRSSDGVCPVAIIDAAVGATAHKLVVAEWGGGGSGVRTVQMGPPLADLRLSGAGPAGTNPMPTGATSSLSLPECSVCSPAAAAAAADADADARRCAGQDDVSLNCA